MQTACIVFFCIFPIFLEGCCDLHYWKKRTVFQQDFTHRHYRAVKGEYFVMPCLQNVKRRTNVTWGRITDGKGVGATIGCGRKFILTAKDSGKYTCLTCNLSFSLQVVENSSLSCLSMEETSKYLEVGAGGKIPCPGLICGDNTSAIWYKDDEAVSRQNRASCEKNGWLHLCRVYKEDTGVYFCDRTISEGGTEWIFRRAVTVFAVAHLKPSYRPRILNPSDNTTEEVELGGSFTLTCEVFFPIEIPLEKFSPEVRWHMNYEEKSIPLHLEKKEVGAEWTLLFGEENMIPEEVNVTQRAIIQKVTPQHLNSTYTCSASNTVGNSSVTMSLRKKTKVVWPSLVGYPVASLLLVAGLGIFVHVKWLELQLIYKCHFPKGKQSGDNKQYDVMLSYVWSPPAAELKLWMLSSSSGPDRQNSEEGTTTQTPLAVMLPQVLEDQWRYRLWLPERDLLPGGAYMDDVVLAIQKSRMLICVLSADYLSNSKAVFVLESGIQALLQNSTLKLLLIWTNRASVPLHHLNASLPMLVQRALKVLPSLDWASGGATTATNHFWRSLRKAMPPHTGEDSLKHVRPVGTEC